jgi:pimeloyl-ACP methyl ester carboxylesterase
MASSSRGDPWPSEAWPASQPPPYSSLADDPPGPGRLQKQATFLYADPRQSSSQSLSPSSIGDPDADNERRRLLVIYIHGFYGNDQSFRSFPAHVHGYLKDALYDTHSVHSKIYPRYKTYKAIDIAVENFSAWLKPHEDPETDVVLVGHSMGGILAAEVALLVSCLIISKSDMC